MSRPVGRPGRVVDPGVKEYATANQLRSILALEALGTIKKAAKDLGISETTVRYDIDRAERAAAAKGYAPRAGLTKVVAPGFLVKGVSTFYDADGEVRAQWVKQDAQKEEQLQRLLEMIEARFSDLPAAKPSPPPKAVQDEDLLVTYALGDAHIGMYAYGLETGDEDFDTGIATRDIRAAVQRLVASSPSARKCVIINVGDFVHSDNTDNTTTRGTGVDVDTRWSKVMTAAHETLVAMVEEAKRKHHEVEVICAAGNHDHHTAFAIAHGLKAHYRNEPRVTVYEPRGAFHWVEFGKVLLGVTHGDKAKKAQDLALVMATDMAEAWGRTLYRVFWTGHIHHKTVQEVQGCTIESTRTLAARDAWHAGQGYRAQREMIAVTYHREYGELERHTAGVRLIRTLQ